LRPPIIGAVTAGWLATQATAKLTGESPDLWIVG
jgi:hypothetical protein